VDLNPETPGATAEEAAALKQERDELQDRLLRSVAEFDNYRKRTERERRELSDAVAADLIRDVLPVVDDLERALAAATDSPDTALKAGVELIHKQLLEALRRRGAEPLQTVGEDFDPAWHEAMASEPADPERGHRDGEIVEEIRRGYRIGNRLIRPAMVKVAKA
jgi:molecular chaperone GrpE